VLLPLKKAKKYKHKINHKMWYKNVYIYTKIAKKPQSLKMHCPDATRTNPWEQLQCHASNSLSAMVWSQTGISSDLPIYESNSLFFLVFGTKHNLPAWKRRSCLGLVPGKLQWQKSGRYLKVTWIVQNLRRSEDTRESKVWFWILTTICRGVHPL